MLANTSLRYIPVSFNQAVGSTTPAFTAVLSIVMLHKYEQPAVYWSLVPVVLGICIASGFEPAFNMFGFVCCITATAARAFKSVLQVRGRMEGLWSVCGAGLRGGAGCCR